ncbi:unnamed protein product [Spirodela intermedia]|uniref:Uncharacterized protein n=1 Tax=Spirodela intermedia TaxID=51605 RepID=A0A7I8KTY1_SPIIN|nr:unnamed protein product [Spirodela intermedia]
MEWEGFLAGEAGSVVVKVAVFLFVQALVYFILFRSSDVFSPARMKSAGLRTVRSVSIRRLMAVLSDQPAGGEVSPTGPPSRMITRRSSGSDVGGVLPRF